MNNYINHAYEEFKAAGWTDDNGNFKDEMQKLLCEDVCKLLQEFSKHGHSGSSAPYAINLFTKLAKFQPIAPLTGEDSEWNDVSYTSDNKERKLFQNKRASHVFKDDNGAYDVNGKCFWEWQRRPLEEDEPGYPGFSTYKSYYNSRDSHVPVTFPYTVPDKPIYEWRYEPDCDPPAPPQTEEGII